MKYIGCGHTACQLSIDRDIRSINEVSDPHFGCDRLRAFVNASIAGHMRMAIDNAWRDVHSRRVEDLCALRCINVFGNGRNMSVMNEQIATVDHPSIATSPNRGAANQHPFSLVANSLRTISSQRKIHLAIQGFFNRFVILLFGFFGLFLTSIIVGQRGGQWSCFSVRPLNRPKELLDIRFPRNHSGKVSHAV